jgi:hypothetical protein
VTKRSALDLVTLCADGTVGKFKLGGVGASVVYDDRAGLVKIIGGYQELARIVHPHPTISEAVLDAARRSTAGRHTPSGARPWRCRGATTWRVAPRLMAKQ